MYLESDPRLPAPSHPLRHHISPPGSLSRLSPQDSEFSDVDEFGRPVVGIPGVDMCYPSANSARR
jgi:hypothetical protein